MTPPAVQGSRDSSRRFDTLLLACHQPQHGVVVAAYRTAAVARMAPAGRLLTIQAADQAIVPWGIALPDRASLPGRGDAVRLAAEWLTLARSAQTLRLEGPGVDLSVPKGSASAEILRDQLPSLVTQADVGGSLEQLAEHQLHTALHALAGSIRPPSPSEDAVRSAMSRLVGLGTGSTPAGDDMLVGFTVAAFRLASAGLLPAEVPRVIATVLAHVSPAATPELSGEMLHHAAGARAAEPLIAVVSALGRVDVPAFDELVADLRALGGRSGTHMIQGVGALVEAVVGRV